MSTESTSLTRIAPGDVLRPYRRLLRLHGQTSPPSLAIPVLRPVVGSSVADVGCGAGLYGFLLRSAWHFTGGWASGVASPERIVGVDFSPVALERARRHGSYDELLLAGSDRLPLADRSVDTVLSVESLEHLFPDEVALALSELKRVARRRVVIATPTPVRVVNEPWLGGEIAAAERDLVPIERDEFLVLAACVHKSALYPRQLEAAGFRYVRDSAGRPILHEESHVYWAERDDLDVDRLREVVGVSVQGYSEQPKRSWKEEYLALLKSSRDMKNRIVHSFT